MRRAFWILPVLLVVALAVPLGVGIGDNGDAWRLVSTRG